MEKLKFYTKYIPTDELKVGEGYIFAKRGRPLQMYEKDVSYVTGVIKLKSGKRFASVSVYYRDSGSKIAKEEVQKRLEVEYFKTNEIK